MVMSNLQVICVGEALIDKIINKSDSNYRNYLGGAPANVVCALRKLNVPAAFVGCLGDDDFGREFISLFQQLNINIDFLQIAKQSSTRVVKVIRDESGDRSFSGFEALNRYGFADEMLDKSKLINNKKHLREQFINSKYIVTGTNLLAFSKSAESLYFILEFAENFNIKVVIDVNWREIFWDHLNIDKDKQLKKIKNFLNHADILKLASEEAYLFFDTNDPSKISQVLTKQPDVIITNGGNLINWFINGIKGANEVVKHTSEIIDTTGAGDAFLAGLISRYYLNSNLNDKSKIEENIKFACICGLLTCFGVGAIEQQPEEKLVYKFLEDVGS
tara:strand:+ start:1146 stop:2141 length:996 start_codon:yes stop_codon:yes gene_type:complete